MFFAPALLSLWRHVAARASAGRLVGLDRRTGRRRSPVGTSRAAARPASAAAVTAINRGLVLARPAARLWRRPSVFPATYDERRTSMPSSRSAPTSGSSCRPAWPPAATWQPPWPAYPSHPPPPPSTNHLRGPRICRTRRDRRLRPGPARPGSATPASSVAARQVLCQAAAPRRTASSSRRRPSATTRLQGR